MHFSIPLWVLWNFQCILVFNFFFNFTKTVHKHIVNFWRIFFTACDFIIHKRTSFIIGICESASATCDNSRSLFFFFVYYDFPPSLITHHLRVQCGQWARQGFPCKKDRGARRKFWKQPLRGTKILFCGRGLKCCQPYKAPILKQHTNWRSLFSVHYPKRYREISGCGPF